MTRQSLSCYFLRPPIIILVLVVFSVLVFIISFTNSSNQDDYSKQIQDLRSRIEDLNRIKKSVINELRQLGKERSKIVREKNSLLNKNDRLLNQISNNKLQLKQLELDLQADRKQKSDQSCAADRVIPVLFNPLKSAELDDYSNYILHRRSDVRQKPSDLKQVYHASLDHSFCPLSKKFGFSFSTSNTSENDLELVLKSHIDLVPDEQACLKVQLLLSPDDIENIITGFRNILVINLITENYEEYRTFNNKFTIVASPYFPRDAFRDEVDIIIPSVLRTPDKFDRIIGSMPPQSPLERKYFAAYFGKSKRIATSIDPRDNDEDLNVLERTLQTMHRSSLEDPFLFIYNCDLTTSADCYEQRENNIGKSIFLIVLPSETHDVDVETNNLIYFALLRGTIPVLVGKVRLPFDEVVDWRRATISIPEARLPELHFVLKSFSPSDLYLIKQHGRRIFEKYLATLDKIVETLINVVRIKRLDHPPPVIKDVKTRVYYNNSQLILDTNCSTTNCRDVKSDSMIDMLSMETLGPREHPFASQTFRRNYSLLLNSAYDIWNHPMYTPSYLFPSLPTDPVLPSEYKFMALDQGFRPIADGQGGSGSEFSRSLGGDYPNEQFTIVLLTHERKTLLMRTLERLKGTAFLNKILVVWNGINQKPSPSLVWPDLGVPLEIVRVERNSLNNRFLPFDRIETDAIFSMDDDSPLRPDEIVFAFRVWRQSRDSIVGFPGRFHAWDQAQNAWVYNSNHSCELSMVLTGGAFFHKYYTYMYSYFMPKSIRSIVDRFMNCEDIAMNFLVAHLTRKPPIKVTSRWAFHCTNCLTSLSEDDSHFRERHECLNIFASIYGYMPLLNTQHRSDSILFKTRLPKDKQKCFKFV